MVLSLSLIHFRCVWRIRLSWRLTKLRGYISRPGKRIHSIHAHAHVVVMMKRKRLIVGDIQKVNRNFPSTLLMPS